MESVLGRYRNLIILVGVLFLQALGLAVQVKRGGPDAQDTRLIRIWAVGAVTPFERVLVWMQNSTGNIWHNYFYLRGVRAENRELRSQIEQMRLDQIRLSEDAAQARRLQTLLAFKEQFIAKTVAAQVIGSSGSDLSRIIYIDKGEDAGLKRDMAVITSDGIVGKVLQVFPAVSQVLLINDQTSGVGTILEKSRLQGFLKGRANGQVTVEGVMSDEEVTPGERVLTSGGDQIFPKGLPVGVVTSVSKGKDLFLNINVKPSTDLSKLEEVLVLVEKQERQATADDAPPMRAADVLAQRLPQVPIKPAEIKPGEDPKTVSPPAGAKVTPKVGGSAEAKTQTGTTGTSKPAGQAAAASGFPPGVSTGTSSNPAVKKKPSAPQTTSDAAPQPQGSATRPDAPPNSPPSSQPPADDSQPH
jgi:rod shape-determining protein MreC